MSLRSARVTSSNWDVLDLVLRAFCTFDRTQSVSLHRFTWELLTVQFSNEQRVMLLPVPLRALVLAWASLPFIIGNLAENDKVVQGDSYGQIKN